MEESQDAGMQVPLRECPQVEDMLIRVGTPSSHARDNMMIYQLHLQSSTAVFVSTLCV
jgi:hypothetical protein